MMHRRAPSNVERGLIGRDIDLNSPPEPTAPREPRGWEKRAMENERQRIELLAAMRQMVAHLGGLLDNTKAPPKADVLGQMTLVIPSRGVLQREWPTAAQALTVANFGTGTLTVTTQGLQSQAPSVGSGVALVAGNTVRTLMLRGNQVDVYGLPGTVVELTAWSRPRPPHTAVLAPGPADGVLVPAGASTSQTVAFSQQSANRLVVVQNVASVAGGSLQVTINGVTPSGYVYPLLVGPAETTVGAVPLRVGPALSPSPNAVANDVVPRELQIVATATATISYGLDFVAGS